MMPILKTPSVQLRKRRCSLLSTLMRSGKKMKKRAIKKYLRTHMVVMRGVTRVGVLESIWGH